MTERICDFYGCCIGTIETSGNGDKTVRAFSGRILGYYKSSQNVTTDFYGRILYKGDMASALLVLMNNSNLPN